jgi:hypothetical protein
MERLRHYATNRHHALAPQASADTAVAGARRRPRERISDELDLLYLPAVPVTSIARFAVEPVVVVATAEVPVVTPAWVPTISGAPVVRRQGCRVGFGHGCRREAGEP